MTNYIFLSANNGRLLPPLFVRTASIICKRGRLSLFPQGHRDEANEAKATARQDDSLAGLVESRPDRFATRARTRFRRRITGFRQLKDDADFSQYNTSSSLSYFLFSINRYGMLIGTRTCTTMEYGDVTCEPYPVTHTHIHARAHACVYVCRKMET